MWVGFKNPCKAKDILQHQGFLKKHGQATLTLITNKFHAAWVLMQQPLSLFMLPEAPPFLCPHQIKRLCVQAEHRHQQPSPLVATQGM